MKNKMKSLLYNIYGGDNMNKVLSLGMISLGCEKNRIDTELFLGVAKKYGIYITNKIHNADILVVNTCGFIDSAKKESLDTILEVLDYKTKGKTIIVIGCLVERYLDFLKKEIPEVDYYIPIKDYNEIDKVFKEIVSKEETYKMDYLSRVLTTLPHSVYLRIGEGCNNCCTYCAIPLIRGTYHSRIHFDILTEARNLVSMGAKEITVIAQDTSKYGTDLNNNYYIHNLLHDISLIEGIELVRVLYLYPDEITDELINEVATNPKIAPYFDIPIQHASDKMLIAMNRRGNQELIRNLVKKIRLKIPHAIIRTTLITGFPGETIKDFEIMKNFVKEIKFNRLGVFAYSDEEGTKAYDFEPKVDSEIANARKDEIMFIQQEISKELNKQEVGKIYDVIIDNYDNTKKAYLSRNYAYAPDDADGYIYLESEDELVIGNIYQVEITDYTTYELKAKLIK